MRSLDDPDPIPVRWRPAANVRLVDHPANLSRASGLLTASSANVTSLAREFRAMRRRRLVILGGPGSGKTTLAVQLVRELLATRRDHEQEPVPVVLSVAGWDTGLFPRLQDWLASRLAQDYPALRATCLGSDAPTLPVPVSGLATALSRGLAIGLIIGPPMGIAVGLADGRDAGLTAASITALAIGLAYTSAAGLTAWAESPSPEGHADTPLATWRADRALNLLRATAIGLTSGLAGGLASGFGAANSGQAAFAVAVGLTYAVTIGLTTGLAAGRHHAWMAYLIATSRLALAGRLPGGSCRSWTTRTASGCFASSAPSTNSGTPNSKTTSHPPGARHTDDLWRRRGVVLEAAVALLTTSPRNAHHLDRHISIEDGAVPMRVRVEILLAVVASLVMTGVPAQAAPSQPQAAAGRSAIYGGGPFYRGGQAVMDTLRSSGFTTVVIWAIHVRSDTGDLWLNDDRIVSNGQYVGDPAWPARVATLKQAPTSVNRIEVSVGSAGPNDWASIATLIARDGTGSGTVLYRNFAVLRTITGADAINDDDEQAYNLTATTAFANMVLAQGYRFFTFVPYTNVAFWRNLKNNLGVAVDRVYLQLYAGGAGNNPATWAQQLGMPVDPGLWSRHGSGCASGDTPATVESRMRGWVTSAGVRGGFLWLYDDMQTCAAQGTPAQYAAAVNNGTSSAP